jgi:hypothetical protein
MAEETRMTLLSDSLKQVEESEMQARSSVSKIKFAIARMEKVLDITTQDCV